MKEIKVYIEEFLEYLESVRGYSNHTIQSYELSLEQMSLNSQWSKEGKKWLLDIMPLRMKLANRSKKTIALRLSAIRSFVTYLEDHHNISIKLFGDASIKAPTTLPKPIEERFIEEVLCNADIQERVLVSLLYGLGIRISELSSLKLERIHDEWIEVIGKGKKSRQVPLLPSLKKLINCYKDQYSPKRYLFEKGGIPLNSAQLRYRIVKIFRSRGIKITPHQLRHSFATHLLHYGARISDVSKLLGHSSMATTQVYTKLAGSKKLQEYMKAHPLANSE